MDGKTPTKKLDYTKKATATVTLANWGTGFINLITEGKFLDKVSALNYEGYDPVSFRQAIIGAGFTQDNILACLFYFVMKGAKVSKTKGMNAVAKAMRDALVTMGIVDKGAESFDIITLPRIVAAFPLETVFIHAMIMTAEGKNISYKPAVYPNEVTNNYNWAYFITGVASAIPKDDGFQKAYMDYTEKTLAVFNAPADVVKNVKTTTKNIMSKGIPNGLYQKGEEESLRAKIDVTMKPAQTTLVSNSNSGPALLLKTG